MTQALSKLTKIALLALLCTYPVAALSATEASQIKQLQHLIEVQQKQLAQQQKQLHVMKVKLDKLSKEQHIPLPETTTTHTPRLSIPGYKKAHILISGYVNELIMYANDGYSPEFLYGTNDYRNSRLTLTPYIQVSPDFSVGANIQAGFDFNLTNEISQVNPSINNGIEMRKLEVFFKSKTWGTLFVGRGPTASFLTPRQDLSGTGPVAQSGVEQIGGGLIFRNSATDNFSGPPVSKTFNNLDGLNRRNRIRYDTPSWHGFYIATSAVAGKANDIALWYQDKLGETGLAGAVAYTSAADITDDSGMTVAYGNLLSGSLSVLFPSGFSITGASGYVSNNEEGFPNDPCFYYLKLGLMRHYFSPGKTAISVDFGRYNDFDFANDQGDSYGVALVQYIDAWNLTIYTLYRRFKLKRTITGFHPINIAALGAEFKF